MHRRRIAVAVTALAMGVPGVFQAQATGISASYSLTIPVSQPRSFFMQVLDQPGVYTPALVGSISTSATAEDVAPGSLDVDLTGFASECPSNRPSPVLRVAQVGQSGDVSAEVSINGTTTNPMTGAAMPVVDETEAHSESLGTGAETRLLLICE